MAHKRTTTNAYEETAKGQMKQARTLVVACMVYLRRRRGVCRIVKGDSAAGLLLVGRLDALALRLVRARGPRLSQARCAAEGRGPACRAGAEALVGGAAAGAQERRRATAAALQQLDQLPVARVEVLGSIQRRYPTISSGSRISAGSEERGTAVPVTMRRGKVERCLTLVCLGIYLRGAHLLVVRAPNEQRHAGQVPVQSGRVEAGE